MRIIELVKGMIGKREGGENERGVNERKTKAPFESLPKQVNQEEFMNNQDPRSRARSVNEQVNYQSKHKDKYENENEENEKGRRP